MARKSTDTKIKILDTAANLFSTHGFSATSIDDILTAVGITKGAFYYYFKSKDHLCQMILDQAISEMHQLCETMYAADDSKNLLQAWLAKLIEKHNSGQWLYFRLLSRLSIESCQFSGAMQNQLKTYWLWYQSFYETLIRKTVLADSGKLKAEPASLARLYMVAHLGALWLDGCAPDTQDMTAVCETLLKITRS